mmetsp:Transcript_108796/g.325422  ORF Transcript_108796/g.325422 Transcript_108796/m.325422 type:complete len:306 (-) Transcript_108796:1442-2359(-)
MTRTLLDILDGRILGLLHRVAHGPSAALQLRRGPREPRPSVLRGLRTLRSVWRRNPRGRARRELVEHRLVVLDADLAPHPMLPAPHPGRLFRPRQHQGLVHGRQALALEGVHLPDAGAGRTAAQAAASTTGGFRSAGHDANSGETVGVEHDGKVKPDHAVCPPLGHLQQHSVRHGYSLRGAPRLRQKLVGGLSAKVALHEEHGLLDAVLPLGVDLRARRDLAHGALELALFVAGHALVPGVSRDVHPEDVGAAYGQPVTILERQPVLADEATVHAHEAAAEASGCEARVVLVGHRTDRCANAQAS